MITKFDGFLKINKSVGITSYDVIRKLKSVLIPLCGKKIKIGHAGTLDPFAKGLLIIAIGQTFTRQIDRFRDLDKTYRFTTTFGELTDTLDSEGTVVETKPVEAMTVANMKALLEQFLGLQDQVPPQYSAKKVNGVPAYKHARAGTAVELKPVQIDIKRVDLLNVVAENQQFEARITCSKGTYIRCLSRDLAIQYQTVGHTCALEREAIGPYHVKDALASDEISEAGILEHLFR